MLDNIKLKHVKQRGKKITAQCPVCSIQGRDKKGNHLSVLDHGKGAFHCILDCSPKEIFALVGIPEHRELTRAEKVEYARRMSREESAARLKAKVGKVVKSAAEELWERVKAEHQTDLWRSMLLDASPLALDCEAPYNAADVIASAYKPSEVIFFGDVYDTGRANHRKHFDTAETFLTQETMMPRVGCSTFKPESFSRSKANIAERRITLVESDEMSKSESACLYYFLKKIGVRIIAVIDTRGKSLHFWTQYSKQHETILKRLAKPLKLDAQSLASGHAPLRLPNCIHSVTGKPALLFYLNPIAP